MQGIHVNSSLRQLSIVGFVGLIKNSPLLEVICRAGFSGPVRASLKRGREVGGCRRCKKREIEGKEPGMREKIEDEERKKRWESRGRSV